MIIKRGLLIFVVLFLIVPFVFAANGCCGETVSENTCVYTSEENCDTPSYFNENAQCEDTSFCGVGCCEKPDGLCSEGAGEYSCDVVDGEWSGGSCDSLDSCEKVKNEAQEKTEPFRKFTSVQGTPFTGRVLSYEGQTFFLEGKDKKIISVPLKSTLNSSSATFLTLPTNPPLVTITSPLEISDSMFL